MDVNEHRPYRSLTQSRMGKEPRHLGPSMEAQSCRGQPPHRLHSEECVALPKKSYSSSETLKAYDQENRLLYDREEELSHQDRLARLWGREVTGGNSCVSSRANSVLTLTDTEHDNKSDNETDPLTPSSHQQPSTMRPPLPPHPNERAQHKLVHAPSQHLPHTSSPQQSLHAPHAATSKHHKAPGLQQQQQQQHGRRASGQLEQQQQQQQQASSVAPAHHNSLGARSSLRERRGSRQVSVQPFRAPEPLHLRESWELVSIPLDSRTTGKQAGMENGQEGLIEMAVFSPAYQDLSYGDGHFAFKVGTSSTPLFGTTGPGYPLGSNTVYSTPPRPLPRGTFPRAAPSLKPAPSACSWRCTALVAITLALALTILLAYFVVLHVYGLDWRLQRPVGEGAAGSPDGPTRGPVVFPGRGKAGGSSTEVSLDSGRLDPGQVVVQDVPPGEFWRSHLHVSQPHFFSFNISIDLDAALGFYGRKGLLPTHTQYDFVEVLDGKRLGRARRSATSGPHAGFTQFLQAGVWHLALYNDGADKEHVALAANVADAVGGCPGGCHGNGVCLAGICHCNQGFLPPHCSRASCPVLCSGHGQYVRGRCLCHSGWKGAECDIPAWQCTNPACGGHGSCITGVCVCNSGYTGESCEEVMCPHPTCSGKGVCVHGTCICLSGWGGPSCETRKPMCAEQCSGHGLYLSELNTCSCDARFTGADCSTELCPVDCGAHGVCIGGSCHCQEGWGGETCDQKACHRHCAEHGACRDGKCECSQGWNGEHCSVEGCPAMCSGNGECRLAQGSWLCVCVPGWRGPGCDTSMETNCGDGEDNDGDGLADCVDPDCCGLPACQAHSLCQGSPDPRALLPEPPMASLSRPPPGPAATFYERMRFLLGTTHLIPGGNPFLGRSAVVVRGVVQTSEGFPLVGVNITFLNAPQHGYTLTRQDGSFDLMASGGVASTLRFERPPFPTQLRTLWLPWDHFVVMETVVMRREENEIPTCDVSGLPRPSPLLLPSLLPSGPGACEPSGTIVPEIQAVQDIIALPGSDLQLVYLSSRAVGYKSLLTIILTPASIPFNLLKVHLTVAVEGRLFHTWFPATPGLRHTFQWDSTDAYGQPVTGHAQALVSVGYEYEPCPALVIWERRSAVLLALTVDSARLGGWTLSNHHVFDVHSSTVHKGSGESVLVWQLPPVISSVMGNGRRRSISCPSCNGVAEGNKLLAPMGLACAPDGSLYVGDFNFVRRILPSGNVTSVFELRNKDFRHSTNPTHRYYLAVDPVSGWLYLSDTSSRKIYRVRSAAGDGADPVLGGEVVAGTGEQCLPLDETRCGDGGRALNASLANPRGIAVDKHGYIFFVDGSMIRKIDENEIISTVMGFNDLQAGLSLSCDSTMEMSKIRLEWPTALTISPLDNSLYILDNNVVLQVTEDHQVRVAVGRPVHCPFHSTEQPWPIRAARHATLQAPTALAVSHAGVLYISETDEKRIHQVWQVSSDGEMSLLAGATVDCDCNGDLSCDCFAGEEGYAKDARLNSPTALAVCPDATLYIADLGNIRIRAVRQNRPATVADGKYEIASPADQEVYVFSEEGLHLRTQSLVSGDVLYSFSYSAERELLGVSSSSGRTARIRRDSGGAPLRIVLDDSLYLTLTLNVNGALKGVAAPGAELAFLTYHGSSGLLATRSDENGWTTFYTYDGTGRLTNVTSPTGVVSSLRAEAGGSWHRVHVDSSGADEDLTLTTNLSRVDVVYSLDRGTMNTRYVMGYDGSLRMLYPDGLELGLQMEPHVLAGTSSPTASRRNLSLPADGGSSSAEWRLRKEQSHGQIAVLGRKLRVNGRNILSIDFDRETRTEKIYDDHRKFQLRVVYGLLGLPSLWLPGDKLTALNVTYSERGRVAGLQWGSMVEHDHYDSLGRVVTRVFADGKTWSYTYLEKSMVLLLQSQRQYIFEFDAADRLVSVTMPSVARHTLGTVRSIGYYRNVYLPPESNASVFQDFSEDGLLLQTAFMGTGRRVLYKYAKQSRLSEVLYDGTHVTFSHDDATGMLKLVNLQDSTFTSAIRFRLVGPLLNRQIVRFGEEGMVNARFDYSFDSVFRIASMQVVINETPLPIDLYQYDDISGKVEQFGKFAVIYFDIHQIITTAAMTLTKHFDSFGRLKEVQYEVYRSLMFWMVLNYDAMGRVAKCELKIGPYANTTKLAYEYDTDGQLHSVSINNRQSWKYSYDLNGNLHLLNPGNSARLTPLRYDLRDRVSRLGDMRYVVDDDGFLRQRGSELFEYNSNGLLMQVYSKASGWSVQYRYDGLGRRVSRKTNFRQHLQYFYADLANPGRVTHMYNHTNSEIITLYYDLQGHLFSVELNSGDEYYVATDGMGTPLAVFDNAGQVVRYLQYTAYGEIYSDSNPDFQLPIGFHGGLYDPLTMLVHFGWKDYDVLTGRWTSPEIELWKEVSAQPKPFNLYMFQNNNPVSVGRDAHRYVTDVNSWLQTFGFQLHNVVAGYPKLRTESYEPSHRLKTTLAPASSKSLSWVECLANKQLKAFMSLKSLPPHWEPCRPGQRQKSSQRWFTPMSSLLGKGVMIANNHGQIYTDIINIASEDCRKIATVLNSSHYLERFHFTVDGKDTHFFVKSGSSDWDLAVLGVSSGHKLLENGANVSISQSTAIVNGRSRRYMDVSLSVDTLLLNVRYGASPDEERARVLEQARQRALGQAWAHEQQRVRDGEEGGRQWSDGEKRQLLGAGRVAGYEGFYVLPVNQFPELADSANNVQFLRQTEIGRR
uniref:Teneurin-3-like isoform X2 n=1 Tax=Petromyzon marinus TaxID=7757 RepID=A0AAJ7WYQ2_PETMA|nr:teneurin-3-like isoform X2 [Petromyzon marinus]